MSEPTYVEVWEVSGNPSGNRVCIAYTERDCPTLDYLIEFRNCMAEAYNCKLEYLIRTDIIEQTSRENYE